jgi:hypothetical protein
MTSRVDFQQVCLTSVERFAAKAKEDECKEIVATITRLAGDIEAATDGLLKARLPRMKREDGSYDTSCCKYFWIGLENAKTKEQQNLVLFESKFGGYPVRISYPCDLKSRTNFTTSAKNRECLEHSLARMLYSPVIAELIYSLMNEQRTGDGELGHL